MQIRLVVITVLFSLNAVSQDTVRFQKEVLAINEKYDTIWDNTKETIVFTGSSSIRSWNNLQDLFPDYQIINSGFGGSQAIDLLLYTDELILKYNPKKVFIYEGDNDLNDRKKPREIISITKEIIAKIRSAIPDIGIVIISAKPSLARWHLRGKYKRLNRKFKHLCKEEEYLDYAYIWDIMLDGKKLRRDIFIEDGLHMNAKGYELWYQIINNYMK